MGAQRRADPDAPLEFPSGEARHGRGGNIRAGARENARKACVDGRWPGSRRGRIYRRERSGSRRTCFFSASRISCRKSWALPTSFSCRAISESFGLAALEAMACEVPVIASDVGGLPEVVTNGVDGYLIPPRDVAAAAKYAIEILTHARSRPRNGPAGANQRAPEILLERRDPAIRGILPESAERIRRDRARLVYSVLQSYRSRIGTGLNEAMMPAISFCVILPFASAPRRR